MTWMRTIVLAVVLLGPPVQRCSARSGELPPTWHFRDGLSHPSYDALGVCSGGIGKRAHPVCSSPPSSTPPHTPPHVQGLRGGGLAALISNFRNGAGKVWNAEAATAAEVPAEVPVEVAEVVEDEDGVGERRGRPKGHRIRPKERAEGEARFPHVGRPFARPEGSRQLTPESVRGLDLPHLIWALHVDRFHAQS